MVAPAALMLFCGVVSALRMMSSRTSALLRTRVVLISPRSEGQDVVLFEREAEGDLGDQLVRGQGGLAGGQGGVGGRGVLRAREEVDVAELGRDVERLAGHREHGDEGGDLRLEVHVHP